MDRAYLRHLVVRSAAEVIVVMLHNHLIPADRLQAAEDYTTQTQVVVVQPILVLDHRQEAVVLVQPMQVLEHRPEEQSVEHRSARAQHSALIRM